MNVFKSPKFKFIWTTLTLTPIILSTLLTLSYFPIVTHAKGGGGGGGSGPSVIDTILAPTFPGSTSANFFQGDFSTVSVTLPTSTNNLKIDIQTYPFPHANIIPFISLYNPRDFSYGVDLSSPCACNNYGFSLNLPVSIPAIPLNNFSSVFASTPTSPPHLPGDPFDASTSNGKYHSINSTTCTISLGAAQEQISWNFIKSIDVINNGAVAYAINTSNATLLAQYTHDLSYAQWTSSDANDDLGVVIIYHLEINLDQVAAACSQVTVDPVGSDPFVSKGFLYEFGVYYSLLGPSSFTDPFVNTPTILADMWHRDFAITQLVDTATNSSNPDVSNSQPVFGQNPFANYDFLSFTTYTCNEFPLTGKFINVRSVIANVSDVINELLFVSETPSQTNVTALEDPDHFLPDFWPLPDYLISQPSETYVALSLVQFTYHNVPTGTSIGPRGIFGDYRFPDPRDLHPSPTAQLCYNESIIYTWVTKSLQLQTQTYNVLFAIQPRYALADGSTFETCINNTFVAETLFDFSSTNTSDDIAHGVYNHSDLYNQTLIHQLVSPFFNVFDLWINPYICYPSKSPHVTANTTIYDTCQPLCPYSHDEVNIHIEQKFFHNISYMFNISAHAIALHRPTFPGLYGDLTDQDMIYLRLCQDNVEWFGDGFASDVLADQVTNTVERGGCRGLNCPVFYDPVRCSFSSRCDQKSQVQAYGIGFSETFGSFFDILDDYPITCTTSNISNNLFVSFVMLHDGPYVASKTFSLENAEASWSLVPINPTEDLGGSDGLIITITGDVFNNVFSGATFASITPQPLSSESQSPDSSRQASTDAEPSSESAAEARLTFSSQLFAVLEADYNGTARDDKLYSVDWVHGNLTEICDVGLRFPKNRSLVDENVWYDLAGPTFDAAHFDNSLIFCRTNKFSGTIQSLGVDLGLVLEFWRVSLVEIEQDNITNLELLGSGMPSFLVAEVILPATLYNDLGPGSSSGGGKNTSTVQGLLYNSQNNLYYVLLEGASGGFMAQIRLVPSGIGSQSSQSSSFSRSYNPGLLPYTATIISFQALNVSGLTSPFMLPPVARRNATVPATSQQLLCNSLRSSLSPPADMDLEFPQSPGPSPLDQANDLCYIAVNDNPLDWYLGSLGFLEIDTLDFYWEAKDQHINKTVLQRTSDNFASLPLGTSWESFLRLLYASPYLPHELAAGINYDTQPLFVDSVTASNEPIIYYDGEPQAGDPYPTPCPDIISCELPVTYDALYQRSNFDGFCLSSVLLKKFWAAIHPPTVQDNDPGLLNFDKVKISCRYHWLPLFGALNNGNGGSANNPQGAGGGGGGIGGLGGRRRLLQEQDEQENQQVQENQENQQVQEQQQQQQHLDNKDIIDRWNKRVIEINRLAEGLYKEMSEFMQKSNMSNDNVVQKQKQNQNDVNVKNDVVGDNLVYPDEVVYTADSLWVEESAEVASEVARPTATTATENPQSQLLQSSTNSNSNTNSNTNANTNANANVNMETSFLSRKLQSVSTSTTIIDTQHLLIILQILNNNSALVSSLSILDADTHHVYYFNNTLPVNASCNTTQTTQTIITDVAIDGQEPRRSRNQDDIDRRDRELTSDNVTVSWVFWIFFFFFVVCLVILIAWDSNNDYRVVHYHTVSTKDKDRDFPTTTVNIVQQ